MAAQTHSRADGGGLVKYPGMGTQFARNGGAHLYWTRQAYGRIQRMRGAGPRNLTIANKGN